MTDERAVEVLAREARDRASRVAGDSTGERAEALQAFAGMLERIVEGGLESAAATRDQVSGEVTGAYLRGGFPDQELWRRVEDGRLSTPERLVEHLLARGGVREGAG